MSNLYRVIKLETWQEVKGLKTIPRCNNDNKINRIHLNILQAVESIAEAYFEPEEQPIVLEINVSDFSNKIEWSEPTESNKWKQPLVDIPNLPTDSVVKIHTLKHSLVDGKNQYKLEMS